MRLTNWVERVWYSDHVVGRLLAPLGWLYSAIVDIRRSAYASGLLPRYRAPIPVIIVGNITVGGTGKTPLVIRLCNFLKENKYNVGVISRGFGGRAKDWPRPVYPDSDPGMVGDEPVLIARHCACPVMVGPNRRASVEKLLLATECDVIVSDDGLQHLGLERDIEICVVDGVRRFGNGRCLPAGPLREPVTRLRSVDFVMANGKAAPGEYPLRVVHGDWVALDAPALRRPMDYFIGRRAHAVAGIANPSRFFELLQARGIEIVPHYFPDHHPFKESDLLFDDGLPVLMTEKDAVKRGSFSGANRWYLPLELETSVEFEYRLIEKLERSDDHHG